MTHAARRHRALDAELAERLARDGKKFPANAGDFWGHGGNSIAGDQIVPGHGGALVYSRRRMMDAKTMSDQRQTKVLFSQLTECTSARGTKYMKG